MLSYKPAAKRSNDAGDESRRLAASGGRGGAINFRLRLWALGFRPGPEPAVQRPEPEAQSPKPDSSREDFSKCPQQLS